MGSGKFEWINGYNTSSESLGFRTFSPSTNNLSGRIDHFLIYEGAIYLHKIEVNLVPESIDYVPEGAEKK